MKIVVATDSFKGSLSSLQVGQEIKQGIINSAPHANVEIVGIADGGEGTVEVLLHANGGERVNVSVHDPLMNIIEASYAVISVRGEDCVIIESAQSTGLNLVPLQSRNPLNTNSFGLGELIKDALAKGYRKFYLTLGGSATNDAGIGMLQALGWKFFDEKGEVIGISRNPLVRVEDFNDSQVMSELKECTFTVMSDVTNPFYGEQGAVQIFSRQKGATREQMILLEAAMFKFAKLIEKKYKRNVQDVKGAGAAGGLGGALASMLDANIQSGIDLIINMVGLEGKIKEADLIITGEGSLDGQSVMGKVPVGVAKLAKKHHKVVIGIAGRIDTELHELNQYLDAVFSIQTECRNLADAMSQQVTSKQLQITTEQIIRLVQAISSIRK
ncbi:glycerate kinase family protein [Bacillus massiliigorillae]|uniref:glycerate kinase family protein n=1 Tax=Bacillus massiliigorillae TaxID=1243664 RepID=UPI0003A50534|nr:glycerate kinase [Bacillus massiliigorillae]